ncbi:glutathione S-transferase family protein [Desertibaculum subflavum]|uniref:glutathione S-transferase family protein n=1 Tax=Desertibaculum subflavum TaxID=2268458 RepID=UPI000E666374
MLTLYDYMDSGNGYKARLLLHQLAIPYRRIELDIDKGETRTAAFLAKNPNGRVPALELDDSSIIAESDAIIWYLAEDTPFLPEGRLGRAQALQWMFFEQYSHEPYVATPRYILRHLAPDNPRRSELPERQARGRAALAVMETHLATAPFFVGGHYSIADIALYAYTHVADQAGIDLTPYPAVRAWLGRVAAEPRHIPITQG